MERASLPVLGEHYELSPGGTRTALWWTITLSNTKQPLLILETRNTKRIELPIKTICHEAVEVENGEIYVLKKDRRRGLSWGRSVAARAPRLYQKLVDNAIY